jgi:hypothetical protein
MDDSVLGSRDAEALGVDGGDMPRPTDEVDREASLLEPGPEEAPDRSRSDDEDLHGRAQRLPEAADEVGQARGRPEVAAKQGKQLFVVAGLLPRLADFQEEVLLLPSELPDLGLQPALGRDQQFLPIGKELSPRHR